jgi:hypothetical protein
MRPRERQILSGRSSAERVAQMAHREFQDQGGRSWQAWDVHPATAAAWLNAAHQAVAVDRGEGTPHHFPIFAVSEDLRAGWLAFQSGGECRRLAPIPANWAVLSDESLITLLNAAHRTSRSFAPPIEMEPAAAARSAPAPS